MYVRPRTALISFALATSALAGACGSTASEIATTTIAETPSSAVATTDTAPTNDVASMTERTDVLVKFATAWDGADWEQMELFAPAEVVDVATQWREDGRDALTSMQLAIENDCAVAETGTCEIVYAGGEGPGMIFNVTYELTDSGTMVTQLLFQGDAG